MRRMSIPLTVVGLLAILAGSAGVMLPAAAAEVTPGAVLARLRDGGHVIYIRHAATDTTQSDAHPIDPADCETQRNLSDEGRAQARALGEALRARGTPVGEVLASPFCRTKETATLAFGTAMPLDSLSYSLALPKEAADKAVADLKQIIGSMTAPGTNRVVVGHFSNLTEATGIRLAREGDAFVFAPLGGGEFTPVGGFSVQDLSNPVRDP